MHGPGSVREAQFTQKEDIAFKPELLNKSWRLKRQHATARSNVAAPQGRPVLSPTFAQVHLPERHVGSGMAQSGAGKHELSPQQSWDAAQRRQREATLGLAVGGSRFATLAGFDAQFQLGSQNSRDVASGSPTDCNSHI